MDKQRLVMVGAGLAIALVVVLGFLFGIQPQLSAASTASEQAASITEANRTSQAALANLEKDYRNLGRFSDQLTELQRSVPPTASMDALTAELDALAAATGVTISQFTPGEAVAYAPPAASAPAASPPPAGTGGSGASTPSPTPTPAAPAAPSAPPAPKTATNPLITGSNFVAIPLKIGIKGTTDSAIAFLGALQHGQRLVLVTGFSGSKDAEGGSATAAPAAPSDSATYAIDALAYVLTTAPSGSQATTSSGQATAPKPSPSPSR
jgi:hypothetical protein